MLAAKIRLAARAYLLLALLQGLLVLGVLLRQRSESGQAVLFGFSATRLTLVAVLLAVVGGWALLLLASFIRPAWFERESGRLAAWLSRPKVWGWVFVLSLVGFLSGPYLLLLTPEVSEPFTRAIFDRLLPLLLYLSGLCAQNLLVLGALRAPLLRQNKKSLFLFVVFYLLLVFLAFHPWLSIVADATGFRERATGWNEMTAPIMDTQVFLVSLLAFGVAGLLSLRLPHTGETQRSRHISPWLVDWIIVLGLWLAAALLWNSIPINSQFFITDPIAPNFEYYPKYDAQKYDFSAQIMLVGEGYHFVSDLLSHRPIHTLYLTLLHIIAGQDYQRVVFFQGLFLAIFPGLVYLLTRKLANRLAGLMAALLIILRQTNSIVEASSFTSNVKTLLVDLPGAVGIALLLLLLVRWLENPRHRLLDLLLAGGAWGMLILLRQEFAGLALTILLALLVAFWKLPRWMLKGGMVFGLGTLLVLSPWLYRNTSMVGLSLEEIARYQIGFLRWRYSVNTSSPTEFEVFARSQPNPTPTPLVPVLGEPLPRQVFVPAAVTPPAATLAPGARATPTAVMPIVESGAQPTESDPTRLPFSNRLGAFLEAGFLHAINNQDQLLFYLPGSTRIIDTLTGFLGHQDPQKLWDECCTLKSYMRRLTYWPEWDGHFLSQSIVPLLVNLFLLAMGIAAACQSPRRLAGLLPLLAVVNFILLNAAIQNSGGRYILPVDWVSLLYYSAGLAAVSWWLVGILKGKIVHTASTQPGETAFQALFVRRTPLLVEPEPRQRFSLRNPWLVAALVGLFLLGCALPFMEKSIPRVYPPEVQTAMLENLLGSDMLTATDRSRLEYLLAEPGSAVYTGRALYPRFFEAGEGELGSRNPFIRRPYSYLGFYLAGPESRAIIMPLESPPDWLPNTADVLVIAGADRRAGAIAVFDADLQPVQLLLGAELPLQE